MLHYGEVMAKRADTKVAVTLRLPYDQYREVAERARKREWSINHYVSHCIAREIGRKARPDRSRVGNRNIELVRDALSE